MEFVDLCLCCCFVFRARPGGDEKTASAVARLCCPGKSTLMHIHAYISERKTPPCFHFLCSQQDRDICLMEIRNICVNPDYFWVTAKLQPLTSLSVEPLSCVSISILLSLHLTHPVCEHVKNSHFSSLTLFVYSARRKKSILSVSRH